MRNILREKGNEMKILVTVTEAYQLFQQEITRRREIGTCPVEYGLGHRLAEAIYAPLPQPPFSKSAMDGFVFRMEDIGKRESFIMQGALYAGDNPIEPIKENHCFKIMTGAKVPDNGHVVVRQEDCVIEGNTVKVLVWPTKGNNICIKGEDFKEGELLIPEGTVLDYIHIALLSSIGRTEIMIYKKPRIAVLISGSEVCQPGKPLIEGKIYDSNAMMIKQRLLTLGYGAKTIEFLQDDKAEVSKVLEQISQNHDMIVTTGGVSVGEKDIFHDALEMAHAKKVFWKVALKPGTPAIFSMLNGCPIISLSGNPFAVGVTFEMLARKVLYEITNDDRLLMTCLQAPIKNAFQKTSDKSRFVRAKWNGTCVEVPEGLHASYALKSMMGCNALVELPARKEPIKAGEEVTIWLL